MSKRIEIIIPGDTASNVKYYRVRRGKLVEIPPEWVGKVTYDQTKRKRKRKDK